MARALAITKIAGALTVRADGDSGGEVGVRQVCPDPVGGGKHLLYYAKVCSSRQVSGRGIFCASLVQEEGDESRSGCVFSVKV